MCTSLLKVTFNGGVVLHGSSAIVDKNRANRQSICVATQRIEDGVAHD